MRREQNSKKVLVRHDEVHSGKWTPVQKAGLMLFCGLLTMVTGYAQQAPGEVRGTVVDARGGEMLSNVVIQLVGGSYRMTTDEAGKFQITSVASGDYVLNVSTVGYRLIKKPFHLDPGETKVFEITLSPDTFRQTDTVEVKSAPFDIASQDSPSTLVLAGNDAKNLASVMELSTLLFRPTTTSATRSISSEAIDCAQP